AVAARVRRRHAGRRRRRRGGSCRQPGKGGAGGPGEGAGGLLPVRRAVPGAGGGGRRGEGGVHRRGRVVRGGHGGVQPGGREAPGPPDGDPQGGAAAGAVAGRAGARHAAHDAEVTEFTCGGFVVGLISVHTIADGLGAGQFINAVGDYARGLPKPRVSPVWARDLIPDPPRMPAPPPKLELLDLREFTVDLTPDHIAKAKSDFFMSMGQRCSAFDVCVAKTWQSRTRALRLAGRLADDHPVHVCFFANTRHLMLAGAAEGFYGNCFYPVTVTCSSAEVATGEVVDVVRAVRDAKARLAGDVARWAVGGFAQDPYELRFTYDSLFVSDWTRLGFLEADYGWGAPTHVVPFSYHPFMAVAVIGAPPAPKIGARVMTMCVEEAHLPEFRDQMNPSPPASN
uniref:3'-N-debenzoyl-2'-deoxytaxol N-benzoyltransferase n=1 Tax=Aegilops tauschii subsp. strangulata TaxID=200361 RepID=A0A452XXF6_AEGTS